MGLFDDAPSYNDMNEKKAAKYLQQGVHLLTFSHAAYRTATSSANKAVELHFLTGYEDKDGNPETKPYAFWMMDKNKSYLEMRENTLKALRETLWKTLGLKFEEVSSISDLSQFDKLEGLTQQVNKQTKGKKIEATITYGWPKSPGTNGKYYQEIMWVNPASDFDYRSQNTTFPHSTNPNPRNTDSDAQVGSGATTDAAIDSSGFGGSEADNDLPF